MRYTSGWLTVPGRAAGAVVTVAAPALPLILVACGPPAIEGTRNTGATNGPGSPGPASTPAAAPATTPPAPAGRTGTSLTGTVTMQRSGGFAGVMQSVAISADGAWTFTDRRAGTVRRGQMSQLQRQRLAQSLTDPALARQAAASTSVGVCSDGYLYEITWGSQRTRLMWCGSVGNHPAVVAVITAIEDATPM
ncbi:MAG: hypothetical protein ACM30G_10235 [Micromonosporaceae bacterium]